MNFPLLENIGDIRGRKILLRLDFNVPLEKGAVADSYRISRIFPTLSFLKERGALSLIVSHIEGKGGDSLRPVAEFLRARGPIAFVETMEAARAALDSMEKGGCALLENIRRFKGEKENDEMFAKTLASLADYFVNDAFSVSHRAHASIVGVPKFIPGFAGLLFEEEVKRLSKAFSPAHPFLLILGGAKFETKLPLLRAFAGVADVLYVCGALANDIYKARGYETGISLVSGCAIEPAILENPKMRVPTDVIARSASGSLEKGADAVEPGEKIVDAGSNALSDLRALIEEAAFVLWNGPLGEYENGYDAGTKAVAQMLALCDAETIIGGGDSVAVVGKLGLLERFSFVSTGGGAMLEFLANGTLPGIEALLSSSVIPAQAGI